jgi:hypothetical protein
MCYLVEDSKTLQKKVSILHFAKKKILDFFNVNYVVNLKTTHNYTYKIISWAPKLLTYYFVLNWTQHTTLYIESFKKKKCTIKGLVNAQKLVEHSQKNF